MAEEAKPPPIIGLLMKEFACKDSIRKKTARERDEVLLLGGAAAA